MKQLIIPIIIGGLSVFALGIVWYETIVQWTWQENMKFYIEYQCYKPDTFCESQNPIMMMSALGIAVLGMIITTFCYNRFTYEIPNLREEKQ